MTRFLIIFLALLIWTPVEAKNHRKSARNTTILQRQVLSASDSRRLQYFYMEGFKQKELGHLTAAADLFQHCLDIDSTSPEALYESSLGKFRLRQDSLGVEMMQKACELDPRNPWYLETLASVYLQSNQEDKAIPVLDLLSQLQKSRSDVLYKLFLLQKQRGKTDEAISALNRIELNEGRNLEISRQKYALYVDAGKREKGFGELKSLAEEFPHDMRIPLTLAQEYLNDSLVEQAKDYMDIVRQNDPTNSALQLLQIDYLEQTGNFEARALLRDSLLYSKDVPNDLRAAALGVFSNDLRDDTLRSEKMLAAIDTLMKHPSAEILRVRAAYLLQSQADPDTLASALKELLKLEPGNEAALSYLFEYYRNKLDFDNLAMICRIGTDAEPDNAAYPYYLGLSLGQLKQYDEAISIFQLAKDRIESGTNPDMVADVWELMGDTYHEMNKEAESFAAYDSCLTYQADNAACLNNYAYYLSLKGQRLGEAEQMSYHAVRLEPTNGTYIDTYAWVLFMQEEFSEAKRYIDMVVKPELTDSAILADEDLHSEVIEHAGDINAMCEDMGQALRYWNLAQQKGSDSATLSRKIKLKKYIKQ